MQKFTVIVGSPFLGSVTKTVILQAESPGEAFKSVGAELANEHKPFYGSVSWELAGGYRHTQFYSYSENHSLRTLPGSPFKQVRRVLRMYAVQIDGLFEYKKQRHALTVEALDETQAAKRACQIRGMYKKPRDISVQRIMNGERHGEVIRFTSNGPAYTRLRRYTQHGG